MSGRLLENSNIHQLGCETYECEMLNRHEDVICQMLVLVLFLGEDSIYVITLK